MLIEININQSVRHAILHQSGVNSQEPKPLVKCCSPIIRSDQTSHKTRRKCAEGRWGRGGCEGRRRRGRETCVKEIVLRDAVPS